jgi:hypothetical protein
MGNLLEEFFKGLKRHFIRSFLVDIGKNGGLETICVEVTGFIFIFSLLLEIIYPSDLALKSWYLQNFFVQKLSLVYIYALFCLLYLSRQQFNWQLEDSLSGPGSLAEDLQGEVDRQFCFFFDLGQLGLNIVADSVFGHYGLKTFGIFDSTTELN